MKTGYTAIKRILLGVFFVGATSSSAFAQFGDAGEILRAGLGDANTLMKAYLEPVGKGFGANLNSGWFSTAKTHKTLGFDVTINASIALVPDADLLFNVQELNLQEIEYISNGPETPSVMGEDRTGALIGSQETFLNPETGQQERLFEFSLPQGSGYPYVPGPMLQASIGIIKSTDITVRYLPPLSTGDVDIDLFGLGIKHEINQWLPGGRLIPVDLSVQAGFTSFNASVDFDVLPNADNDTENNFDPSTWDGQKAEFSASAFTINALVGKTLPVISVYGGLGYQTSTVEISTPGSYPIVVPNEDFNPGDPASKPKKVDKIDDPIDLKYDDNSSFHALLGARIKLLIFNISASYTFSEYPVAQVGFGFGIR